MTGVEAFLRFLLRRMLFALEVIRLMCLFHFRSDVRVRPRYLVESMTVRVWLEGIVWGVVVEFTPLVAQPALRSIC